MWIDETLFPSPSLPRRLSAAWSGSCGGAPNPDAAPGFGWLDFLSHSSHSSFHSTFLDLIKNPFYVLTNRHFFPFQSGGGRSTDPRFFKCLAMYFA